MTDRAIEADAAPSEPAAALRALATRLPDAGLALADEAALSAFGAELQQALASDSARSPVRLSLEGDLGAGKSTLARAVLRAFGHAGAVRSPTYTLIERYDVAGLAIAHVDLYRLTDPLELEPIGFDELLDECDLVMIEWAMRGAGALPPFSATVRLETVPSGRLGGRDDGGSDDGAEPRAEARAEPRAEPSAAPRAEPWADEGRLLFLDVSPSGTTL